MAEPRYRPPATPRPSPFGSRPAARQSVPGAIPAPPPGFEVVPANPTAAPAAPQNVPPPPPGFELQSPSAEPAEPTTYDTYVKPVGQAISSAAEGVHEFFVGKHDPKFKGLPSIDESETAADAGLDISTLQQAKTVGFTDAQYRDIIQKQLGNRFLGVQKDENGFEVITYMGADGQPRQAYLNKPGLDWQDVDRGVSATLPFMAAGGAMARLPFMAGAPLVVRAGAQGVAGAGASGLQDLAAEGMGSKQGIDPVKAGFAAVGGAAGEYIGAGLSRLLQKYRVDPRYLDDDGKLSEFGRRYVQEKGFDPDLVDKDLAQELARLTAAGANPEEALLQVQSTGRFNIPTTKGQRSADGGQLLMEKELRTGAHGPAARGRIEDFDRMQRQKLENVVRGPEDVNILGKRRAKDYDPTTIGGTLAPHRSRYDAAPASLGEGAQSGFEASVKSAKATERAAWDKVKDITAKQGANESLPAFVQKEIDQFRVRRELHPVASQMFDELNAFMKGKAPQSDFGTFSPDAAVNSIGDLRKVLTGMVRNASSQHGDKAAAGKIYRGFNNWIADIEAKGMLVGDVGAVKAMREAMDVTKEVRKLIAPTDAMGKATATGRMFEKLGNAGSGEEVINALLGASGPKASFKAGGVEALKQYKTLVTTRGGLPGQQAWNDVRLAYWMKLVSGPTGELLGPRAMKSAIQSAMHKQKSAFNVLYRPQERQLMRELVETLKVLDWKDPNPSGTGAAIARLAPKLAGEAARGQGTRERLVKGRILIANVYRALGTYFKTLEKSAGRMETNRAVSQTLTPKAPPSAGGFGSAGAVNALVPRAEEAR